MNLLALVVEAIAALALNNDLRRVREVGIVQRREGGRPAFVVVAYGILATEVVMPAPVPAVVGRVSVEG